MPRYALPSRHSSTYPRTEGSYRLPELESLGWNDRLSILYEPFAGDDVVAGRVSIQHRGAYDVLTELGELRCEVPRRLVHEAATTADLPVVGDWVVITPASGGGPGTITAVLPRLTKFSRKTAWQAAEEQVLAANIDVAFLVASMNEDLSLRRLERYLILAWESGARPVIVLTKSDLHPAPRGCRGRGRDDRRRRARARDLERHRPGSRRGVRAARPGPHRRPARLLGRRQVDARQHARGRGAARDAGDPRRRHRPAHDDETGADPAAERWPRDRLARASARSSSGSPTTASTRRSRTSRSCSPTAGSRTAPTTGSPAAPCRPPSRTGRCRQSAGTAT